MTDPLETLGLAFHMEKLSDISQFESEVIGYDYSRFDVLTKVFAHYRELYDKLPSEQRESRWIQFCKRLKLKNTETTIQQNDVNQNNRDILWEMLFAYGMHNLGVELDVHDTGKAGGCDFISRQYALLFECVRAHESEKYRTYPESDENDGHLIFSLDIEQTALRWTQSITDKIKKKQNQGLDYIIALNLHGGGYADPRIGAPLLSKILTKDPDCQINKKITYDEGRRSIHLNDTYYFDANPDLMGILVSNVRYESCSPNYHRYFWFIQNPYYANNKSKLAAVSEQFEKRRIIID